MSPRAQGPQRSSTDEYAGIAAPSSPFNFKADDLVLSLIHPIYDPAVLDKNGARLLEVDRVIVNAIVEQNESAIPAIEGHSMPNLALKNSFLPSFRWLLFAYADSRTETYSQLRAMVDNANLRFLRGDVNQSLALTLVLTSYVSAPRTTFVTE